MECRDLTSAIKMPWRVQDAVIFLPATRSCVGILSGMDEMSPHVHGTNRMRQIWSGAYKTPGDMILMDQGATGELRAESWIVHKGTKEMYSTRRMC